MRTLVTFVLRLWVDPQAETPAWEGRVENVASGERAHVRDAEELARFIDAQTAGGEPGAPQPERRGTNRHNREARATMVD